MEYRKMLENCQKGLGKRGKWGDGILEEWNNGILYI